MDGELLADGEGVDGFLQTRRDGQAAKGCFRR